MMCPGKVPEIRACTCSDVYSAGISGRHTSSILTTGTPAAGTERAKMTARCRPAAGFERSRRQRRIDMIEKTENGGEPVGQHCPELSDVFGRGGSQSERMTQT